MIFLDLTPKTKAIKTKIKRGGTTSNWKLLIAEENISKEKATYRMGENICKSQKIQNIF